MIASCSTQLQVQASEIEFIEFVHLDRKPIVAARVNGIETYLMVDTGSDISVLNQNVSDEFGFVPSVNNEVSYHIEGLNGEKKSISWAKKVKVSLGSSEIRARFYSMDLSNLVNSVKKKTHITIQGIIGSDIMKKYDFRVDYRNKKIGFSTKHLISATKTDKQHTYYSVLKNGLSIISSKQIF